MNPLTSECPSSHPPSTSLPEHHGGVKGDGIVNTGFVGGVV